jgi:hypothetical protein
MQDVDWQLVCPVNAPSRLAADLQELVAAVEAAEAEEE